jgi:hypothetical protein
VLALLLVLRIPLVRKAVSRARHGLAHRLSSTSSSSP